MGITSPELPSDVVYGLDGRGLSGSFTITSDVSVPGMVDRIADCRMSDLDLVRSISTIEHQRPWLI